MRSWDEVHRLREQEQCSIREISRQLHMSRNTVRRLLALPERPRYCRRDTHSLLDPFKGTVRELLQQDHHLTAPAIHRRLAAAGYTGGVTILKQYLATVRSGFGAGTSRLPPTGESDCSACPQPPMLPLSQQASPAPLGCADADPGELGMNMMSVDFEIIMVNRANEHLFRKPVNELLGRKCYEAFERRTDIAWLLSVWRWPGCATVKSSAAAGRRRRSAAWHPRWFVETKGRDDELQVDSR